MKKTTLFPKHCFLVAAVVVAGISPALVLSLPYPSVVRNPESDDAQADGALTATVEHDSAPWCGDAFSLWIPAKPYGGSPDSWIHLKIWEPPEQAHRKYVFPDGETDSPIIVRKGDGTCQIVADQSAGRALGAVRYYLDLKTPQSIQWGDQPRQELKGWVRFHQTSSDKPVVGEFDFVSETKVTLQGKFKAEWVTTGLTLPSG